VAFDLKNLKSLKDCLMIESYYWTDLHEGLEQLNVVFDLKILSLINLNRPKKNLNSLMKMLSKSSMKMNPMYVEWDR